jgi:hypothetical protein
MILRRTLISLASAAAGIVILSPGGHAQAVTAFDRGWMDQSNFSFNTPTSTYDAGNSGGNDKVRNFFDFNIPTLNGPLLSADLLLDMPANGHESLSATTYSVYSLTQYGSFSFADIGAGTLYGSKVLTSADDLTTVDISLDAAALLDIAAAQGGALEIGGVDSGENSNTQVLDFVNSGFNGEQTVLQLTTGSQSPTTPEPGAAALLAGAGVTVFAMRRKRRSATA